MTAAALREAEPGLRRWGRRLSAIVAYQVLFGVLLAALPALLVLVLPFDLVLRRRLGGARCLLALGIYLGCELVGVAAAAWLWLRWLGRWRAPGFVDANYRLQWWWAGTLFRLVVWLFGLRVEVDGLEAARAGPSVLLVRHASVIDTLLPVALVSAGLGVRLRYVLKRELLWDPCLDIVGQRIPNAFVRRGSGDAREVARVEALAADLGPRDAVLIFPEGTRFSTRRREALLGDGSAELRAQAAALTHVLPLRLGGVQAALARASEADVVFCAHVGFESVRQLSDLWRGALVGRHVRVALWRVPRAEVPVEATARATFLQGQWQRVDAWVGAKTDSDPRPKLPVAT